MIAQQRVVGVDGDWLIGMHGRSVVFAMAKIEGGGQVGIHQDIRMSPGPEERAALSDC